jgi:hypothetical protein
MDKEQYNQFDGFFREAAASEAGPSMPESAWQQMEARLDGEKKRRRFIIWWWWLGASLLLAGGLSFYVLRSGNQQGKTHFPDKSVHHTPQPVQSPVDPIEAQGREDISRESNDKNLATGSVPGSTPVLPQRRIAPDETIAGSPNNLVHAEQKSLENGANKLTGKKTGTAKETLLLKLSHQPGKLTMHQGTAGIHQHRISSRNIQVTAGRQNTDAGGAETPAQPEQEVVAVTAVDTPSTSVLPPPADSLAKTDDLAADSSHNTSADTLKSSVVTESFKPGKKTNRPSHFYVFAGAAPEWTFVSGRGSGPVAISYGGGLGYAFNGRWSVQAGLFRSGKKYSAGEGDYKPRPGSYYDNPNIQIESVAANCAVWEIPMSIRYIFRKNSRSDFFAVASLQSAIMKRETYDYDYKRYGNPAYSSHTYRTNAFNLFSGFGIAAGYERILNKQFSILAIPYFNFPLKGIGEGRINLHSYGMQIGLKYNLPF